MNNQPAVKVKWIRDIELSDGDISIYVSSNEQIIFLGHDSCTNNINIIIPIQQIRELLYNMEETE